jgi:hypothetical protein
MHQKVADQQLFDEYCQHVASHLIPRAMSLLNRFSFIATAKQLINYR